MANEKRLIDANALDEAIRTDFWEHFTQCHDTDQTALIDMVCEDIGNAPTVDAVEVVYGRWILTAHEEYANCRWKVTAECSECNHDKGEIYAGFFTGFPKDIARDVVLDNAMSVKLDNYCPNCGAKMDGDGNE